VCSSDLERLEKYVLEQTFKYLRKIYDDTGSYVRLVVNVSNKTLNTPNFVGFLTNLYRTYKIPYEVVEIKVKLTRFRLEEELKLKELRELNIVIGTDNLDYVNKDYIKVFHLTNKEDLFNPKTQNYLKSLRDYLESENMTFIVYNVDSSKEAEILEKLNINYIRGRVVDKEISYQELVNILNQ
jgi:EAL domain-containing protein (putative c-di-GMP-specific phosphodiesterase class I)